MTKTTLNEILEEICTEEVSEYEKIKPRHHIFSFRHRNAMEEILYPHHCSEEIPGKNRKLPVHKRFLIMTIVIIMAVMSITAGGAMLRGFNRKVYPEYTMLLAANAENCPKFIENVYYLPEIPEGFELDEQISRIIYVITFYENNKTNRHLTFSQHVKVGYECNYDTERQDFEELDINEHYALYLDFRNFGRQIGLIVCDNGDYILEISGNFTKEELIKMAESVKIMGGGIENDRNNT